MKQSTTTQHQATECFRCGSTLDASTRPDAAVPEPGDLTVCAYCATPYTYGPDLGLVALSADALAQLPAEAQQQLAGIRRRVQRLGLAPWRRAIPD